MVVVISSQFVVCGLGPWAVVACCGLSWLVVGILSPLLFLLFWWWLLLSWLFPAACLYSICFSITVSVEVSTCVSGSGGTCGNEAHLGWLQANGQMWNCRSWENQTPHIHRSKGWGHDEVQPSSGKNKEGTLMDVEDVYVWFWWPISCQDWCRMARVLDIFRGSFYPFLSVLVLVVSGKLAQKLKQ